MATQAGRPLYATTPAGADVLLLEGFTGEEGISMPFSYDLRFVSESDNIISADTLLRKPTTITIVLQGGGKKYISGWVNRFVQTGRRQHFSGYEATIVPWLWFLTLDYDCKIFQKMTVPDIIEKVFKDAGYTDFQLKTYKSYSPRDYCVQYRETSFNFVSRLMEEEGIYYYFEHSDGTHTMVLTDSPPGITSCPGEDSFKVWTDASQAVGFDVISSLEWTKVSTTGKVTLNDYNFETPSTDLKSSASGTEKNEIYDYPGKFDDHDGGGNYANLGIELQEKDIQTVAGLSNCRAMTTGYKITVTNHFRDDLNQAYLLTWLRQTMEWNVYGGAGSSPEAGVDYSNQYEAIPFSTNYRPPRRATKAIVQGPQTALVVGPSGEEIYTDKYGRVKVQFYWDRVGTKNENSSCWIRVSQYWAGKTWGSMHIPRMGQEVIVDFLEGDPDRPIITGRVYNAEQTVPQTLPDNMTQSGIKSRSSKGGGSDNYNEIWFEDLKGSELIRIHAEKDLLTEVENDETRTVGHDRTTTIKNDETKTVTQGNEKHTIEQGTHTVTVQGNQTIEIKQGNQSNTLDMGNQSTELKMGNRSVKADLGAITEEAMQKIELTVGQSKITIDQMGVTIQGMMIKITGQVQVQVQGLLTQVNGDAMLQLKGGITMIN
jgi:type VI secretion system secreted protein VgrG